MLPTHGGGDDLFAYPIGAVVTLTQDRWKQSAGVSETRDRYTVVRRILEDYGGERPEVKYVVSQVKFGNQTATVSECQIDHEFSRAQ